VSGRWAAAIHEAARFFINEIRQPALRAEGTQVNLAFGSGGSGPLTLAGPRQYVFMRGPLKIGFIKETV